MSADAGTPGTGSRGGKARDEILARVRSALGRGAGGEDAASQRLGAAVPSTEVDDVIGVFVERVEDYRASVVRCSADEIADRLREALGESAKVVVPPGFPEAMFGLPHGAERVADDALSAQLLDRIDAVVTLAAVGIATTGTIVLDHGPGQGRRALSLVPDTHVCVITAEQLVADVPDAVARLDPTRPLTWISGPSATSDIELDRVEGVHGPRNLHVIVVG